MHSQDGHASIGLILCSGDLCSMENFEVDDKLHVTQKAAKKFF